MYTRIVSYVSSAKMHFKISALGEENTKKISSCLAATNSRKKTIEIKAENEESVGFSLQSWEKAGKRERFKVLKKQNIHDYACQFDKEEAWY